MPAPSGSIIPASYFEGLSSLWGGCAYLGSAIVAAGLVFQTMRSRPDAVSFIWLLTKVFFIAVSVVFIREWLMRLNDIVAGFGSLLGVNPREVDERFVRFVAG